jgi:hypothetical protein
MNVESAGSVPDVGLCALFGESRAGIASQIVGALQRLGVSPDGRTVVFEVNHAHAAIEVPLVLPEEGFYSVHADGTAMRRLGPASRAPNFKAVVVATPPAFRVIRWDDLKFSPNGRFVVFTDRGPGADGWDAVQVFVMNVESGKRIQLTQFVAADQGSTLQEDAGGYFVDDDTIIVYEPLCASATIDRRGCIYTVKKDGSDLRPFSNPDLVPIEGARVIQMFQIVGLPQSAFSASVPVFATDPVFGTASEIFTLTHGDVLQLTNFGRSDTSRGATRNRTGEVLFFASADPLGRNPSHTCQLFLIGSLGEHLRQITRFGPPGLPRAGATGCMLPAAPFSCVSEIGGPMTFDPTTDQLTFDSSCDPFGTNPFGTQFFAVRGNGSGLRQLTNYRGMQLAPTGP